MIGPKLGGQVIAPQQAASPEADGSAETIEQLQRLVEELRRELDEVTLYAAQLRAARSAAGSVYDLPGALRRLRHERGWSQGELVERLGRLGQERNVWMPARDTLRIYVSRWENGHAKPAAPFPDLLDAVFTGTVPRARGGEHDR